MRSCYVGKGFSLCFRVRYYHTSSYVTSVSNGQTFVYKPPADFKDADLEHTDKETLTVTVSIIME
jgi:hypothetical protein